MEDLLKSDLFFVVTTVAVASMSLLVIAILVYIVRIVRDINYIAKQAKKGVEEVVDDLTLLHKVVHRKEAMIERMILSFFNRKTKKKRGRRKK